VGVSWLAFKGGRYVALPGCPVCPTCHGEGERPPRDYEATWMLCPDCEGSGEKQWTDAELAEAEALDRASRREASEQFEQDLRGWHDSPLSYREDAA